MQLKLHISFHFQSLILFLMSLLLCRPLFCCQFPECICFPPDKTRPVPANEFLITLGPSQKLWTDLSPDSHPNIQLLSPSGRSVSHSHVHQTCKKKNNKNNNQNKCLFTRRKTTIMRVIFFLSVRFVTRNKIFQSQSWIEFRNLVIYSPYCMY